MEEIYTEKEILGDALNTEKNATALYNLSANECVHENLRSTMMDLLQKEHEIQTDVFNQMHTMGLNTSVWMYLTKCIQWAFILHLQLSQRKFRKPKPNSSVDIKLCSR